MLQLQPARPQEERQVSRHSFFMVVLFSHYLLEWHGSIFYLIIVAPTLHGLFKDPPSFVTTCTPQGLAVKVTCMQDCRRRISWACIGQELLPFQLSTVYLCTTWRLNLNALALLPGFCIVVSLLPVMKTWLFQGLTWLLPWTPKRFAFLCVKQLVWVSHQHVCTYTMLSLSSWSRLVLSCLLLIYLHPHKPAC